MDVFIKNMVCNRCIAAVKNIFGEMKIGTESVTLGHAVTKEALDKTQIETLRKKLSDLGFELLDDNKKKLIEKMKNIIIGMVHRSDADGKMNLSDLLSDNLHKDYSYLSKLFSEVEGITLEKYLIHQKIERVKELLVYDEKSLKEIAFETGYSSTAHLSSQFKKITGLTPGHFKKIGAAHRRSLDSLY